MNFRFIWKRLRFVGTRTMAFAVVALIVCACNQKQKQQTEQVEPQSSKADLSSKEVKSEEKPFDIEKLPKEWIRLLETDTTNIIYNKCDGGNKLLSIISEEDGFRLLVHGQQEDLKYGIIDTSITHGNNIKLRVGSSQGTKEQIFVLKWLDENKGLASWRTTYLPGYDAMTEIFTTKEFKFSYVEITQPCIECWTEEECDEFALQNG
jgi:hypothetical protein